MPISQRTSFQILLTGLSLILVTGFQNCFQLAGQTSDVAQQTASLGSLEGVTQNNCQFLGTGAMRSILSNVGALDMTINAPRGGDLRLVNAQGQPQAVGHITRSSGSLGEADPALGIAEDNACRTMKFKIATELFVDACQAGLSANRDRFMSEVFPRGFDDRDLTASQIEPLFQKYIGRGADPAELAELRVLASAVSAAVAPAAVCGAVLASFESLVR